MVIQQDHYHTTFYFKATAAVKQLKVTPNNHHHTNTTSLPLHDTTTKFTPEDFECSLPKHKVTHSNTTTTILIPTNKFVHCFDFRATEVSLHKVTPNNPTNNTFLRIDLLLRSYLNATTIYDNLKT